MSVHNWVELLCLFWSGTKSALSPSSQVQHDCMKPMVRSTIMPAGQGPVRLSACQLVLPYLLGKMSSSESCKMLLFAGEACTTFGT